MHTLSGRWHVLGAGAVGCLFADALHRAGTPVTLVLREADGERATITVEYAGGSSAQSLAAVSAADCGPVDHLLVTTKAYDVAGAVRSLAHGLHNDSVILLLVNGMGLAEVLADTLRPTLPGLTIACGSTTEGAWVVAPRHIHHAGRGATRIGIEGVAAAPDWFAPWTRALPPCDWDADIDAVLWDKLAVNCVINPLTAVHRVRNGELSGKDYADTVATLCREVSQVSYAAGYTRTSQTISDTVARVIAGTADNRSSMLQDVLQGRRTEIDHITGYLLGIADQHGIGARENRRLYQEVRDLG